MAIAVGITGSSAQPAERCWPSQDERDAANAAFQSNPASFGDGLRVVVAVLGALALGQFWQQVPVWKAQVEAVTGPVASARRAERLLSRMNADQLDWRTRQQQMVELEKQ